MSEIGGEGSNVGKRFFVAAMEFSSNLYKVSELIWSPKVKVEGEVVKKQQDIFVGNIREKEKKKEIISMITLFEKAFTLFNEMKAFAENSVFDKWIKNKKFNETEKKIIKEYFIADNPIDFFKEFLMYFSSLQKIWVGMDFYIKNSEFLCERYLGEPKNGGTEKYEPFVYHPKLLGALILATIIQKLKTDGKIDDFEEDMKRLEGMEQVMSKIRSLVEVGKIGYAGMFPMQFFYNAMIYVTYSQMKTDMLKGIMRMFNISHTFPVTFDFLLYPDVEDLIQECATKYSEGDPNLAKLFTGECRFMCWNVLHQKNFMFMIALIWYLFRRTILDVESKKKEEEKLRGMKGDISYDEKKKQTDLIYKKKTFYRKVVEAAKKPGRKLIDGIYKEMPEKFYSMSDFIKENYELDIDTPFDKNR
jgi:hypothetical protein